MPLRANIGISRKVADNNFGSRGATVNLEVELDSSLIQEPERLQERIRQVFRLAQQSVDEELARQTSGNDGSNGHAAAATGNGNGNSRQNGNSQPNGNGSPASSNGARNATNGHGASAKQLDYARQLAKSIQGLGIRRLEALAQKMYSKPLTAMSSMDASGLIDTLKSIKAGEIDLSQVLEGTGT
jgi:hypothetical protein